MKDVQMTDQQKDCVNFPVERDLIVTGMAGSGKSLVVVKRAIAFSQNFRLIEPRIAIYTFVNSLVNYTQEVIHEGDRESAQSITVTTLDKEINQLYRLMVKGASYKLKNIYDTKLHFQVLDRVINSSKNQESERLLSEERRKWLMEELCWMKQHMFTDVEEYSICVRKGRGRNQLRRTDRPVIFDIYQRYYQELEKQGVRTIDMVCEELYKLRKQIPESQKYEMVLIDEAQDLPLNKLLIARELAKVSMTVAADFAQKIYNTGFTWKEIGLNIKGKGSQKLNGTHRNTLQIASLASDLQLKNTETYEDGDETIVELPTREGPLPRMIYADSVAQEGEDLVNLVKQISHDSPMSTIGVLGRDFSVLTVVEGWLRKNGIPYENIKNSETKILSPGVKISSYHSAKGLEFDQVILPMVDDGYFPYTKDERKLTEEEFEDLMNNARNLLYVGMTRARQMLYILATNGHGGCPSPLIKELDSEKMHILRE